MAEEVVDKGTPWYQGAEGVDQEMVGHWQNKGWDATDPAKVAIAASKAHRDAERLIGARADHDMVAVPKAPDKGDWNAVWTKLGKPAKADEYDFKSVTFKDGTQLEDGFVNAMRDAVWKANIPKQYAPDVVKAVVSYMDDTKARQQDDLTAKVGEERTALAKNWGTTPEQLQSSPHMHAAQGAVRALGIDPEAVNALEGKVGYAAVMNMFRNIAGKIGEDAWVTGSGKGLGNQGLLTAEQAVARKSELRNDPTWVTKYLSGDVEARREMTGLDTIITNSKAKIGI